MRLAAVVCTGESLKQSDVDLLNGKCSVVVVSDAYKLAPWADALVSMDSAWWKANSDCDFKGLRFHGEALYKSDTVERVYPSFGNSGCLGLHVASNRLGFKPDRIILLGADLKGTHFFGKHTKNGLTNTTAKGFETMKRQYQRMSNLPVVNCSPISSLTCFPKMSLADALNVS